MWLSNNIQHIGLQCGIESLLGQVYWWKFNRNTKYCTDLQNQNQLFKANMRVLHAPIKHTHQMSPHDLLYIDWTSL